VYCTVPCVDDMIIQLDRTQCIVPISVGVHDAEKFTVEVSYLGPLILDS